MFIVSKEGVYRHNCWGYFTTVEEATAKAEELCKAEHDDYHEFAVLTASGDNELKPIKTLKRNDHMKYSPTPPYSYQESPTDYTWSDA